MLYLLIPMHRDGTFPTDGIEEIFTMQNVVPMHAGS